MLPSSGSMIATPCGDDVPDGASARAPSGACDPASLAMKTISSSSSSVGTGSGFGVNPLGYAPAQVPAIFIHVSWSHAYVSSLSVPEYVEKPDGGLERQ